MTGHAEADGCQVQVRHEAGVTLLLLAAPRRRNALDAALRRAIAQGWEAAEREGSAVLLLAGAPAEPPAFAAGADLREIASLTPSSAQAYAAEGQELLRRLEDGPLVTIAAVDGACRGGGLDLALACDFVLATARATFAHPGAGRGIVTGWGGTRRLPARASAAAAGLFVSGRILCARDALAAGVVDRILADEPFLAAAHAMATQVAAAARLQGRARVALLKAVLRSGGACPAALDEAAVALLSRAPPDSAEGVGQAT